MRMFLILAVALVCALPAAADYYVAGDFNGWNAAGNVMTDQGGGIWTVDLNLTGRHEFKVTMGDWSWNVPGTGNAWLYGDAGGVKITFNALAAGDGWAPDQSRISSSVDPGTWTAVGDWQGWNNGNPATAMVWQGGNLYKFQTSIAPGTYQYKAVMTGTWDAIGSDGNSVNANTWQFTTDANNQNVTFWLDTAKGAIKVDVVPEPASLTCLAIGVASLGRLIRRK